MGKSSNQIPSSIVNHLQNFKSISVRDDNTKQRLIEAGFKETKKVLDPTLLEDIRKLYQNQVIDKKYVLIYLTQYPIKLTSHIINEIKEFSSLIIAKFFQLVSTTNLQIKILGISPFEWLDFFANSKYIITNTFHGTVFSILYSKNLLLIKLNRLIIKFYHF